MSSPTSSDHKYTPSDDVDFLITKNQKKSIDIAELDTDASLGPYSTAQVSEWSVDPESYYTGSPQPRYFQYPTDAEFTTISLGRHDSFVDTITPTKTNKITDTSAEIQDSAYTNLANNHCTNVHTYSNYIKNYCTNAEQYGNANRKLCTHKIPGSNNNIKRKKKLWLQLQENSQTAQRNILK